MKKSRTRTLLVMWLVLALVASCACMVFAAAENETAVTYVTGDMMAANPDKCLADYGASAKAPVTENGIGAPKGILAYEDTVEGVEVDIQFTTAGVGGLFFVLRATAQGSPWGGGHGYYAYILPKEVQIYKVDGVGDWNDEPIGAKAFTKNVYDGKVHHVAYSAKENADGKCVITFTLDGETFTGTENTTPLTIAGTSFYTMNNDANNPPAYTFLRGYIPLVDGDEMLENSTKVASDLIKTPATVERGFIYSAADGGFTYNEEVQGVDLTLQYTDNSTKSAFFYLRAKLAAVAAGNAAVNPDTINAYMAYIQGASGISTIQFFRIVEGRAWNVEQLGATYCVTGDLFDGGQHRIKFSAVDKADGKTQVRFEMVGAKEQPFTYDADPLPIADTVFHASANRWAGTAQQFRVITSSVVWQTEYTTVADIFKSKQLKNGIGSGAEQIRAALDIAKSVDGVMVYNKNTEGAIVDVKVTEGESLVFALSVKDVTTQGEGFYYMVSKAEGGGTTVQLVKASEKTREVQPTTPTEPDEGEEGESESVETASETDDGESETEEPVTETYIDYEVLATVTKADVEFFDGNVHTVKVAAAYVDGFVFDIDEESFLSDEDLSAVELLETDETCFVITYDAQEYAEGTYPVFEMHGENATTATIPENAYNVYTSKSLLKAASLWETSDASVSGGTAKSINAAENRVLYSIALENAMYNFDIDLSKLSSGWIAFCLNANKLDAPWNAGYHSILLRVSGNKIYIEEFAGQTEYDVISIADLDLTKVINFECGVYNVTADNGKKYTFLRLVIDGKEYYNNDLPYGAYGLAGSFGISGFGAGWTMYATENELAKSPALINATQEERGDESGVTTPIAVDDWAPVMNSFAPAYKYVDDEMILNGNGDVSYKAAVNFSKLSFDFKLDTDADAKGQYLQFFFNRKRQEQFMTSASGGDLTLDASNYGYGVRILSDGTIELIRTTTGNNSMRLMSVSAEGVFDVSFVDGQYHTMTVYREILAGGGLKITLFVDDKTIGYSYTHTDYYADNYPMAGYISFNHSTNNTYASIKNIKFEGEEIAPTTTYKANALNFVTYYPDATGETGGTAYFVPYGADAKTKWVEMYGLDANNEYTVLLGTAFVPERALEIPKTYTGASVRMVAVGFTAAGNYTFDLQLKDTEAEHTVPQDKVERIAIQESEAGAYFIYADSKKEYMPVGANYMGLRGGDHSTFDAATSFTEADYDPIKTDAMMREFAAAGGNVLRVFIIGRTAVNPGISGDSTIPVTDEEYYYEGLYLPYMENVAHFLAKAKQYGVYVMITLGDADVPNNSYYLSMMGGVRLARNMMYLDNRGIAARTAYARNVTKYFTEKHPELVPAIFSISFQNEFAMNGNEEPFARSTGTYTAPNGKTYDMSNDESRQALFEEGVVYYLNAMTKAVKDVDPNMLCSEGTYTLNIVGNGEEIGCPPVPTNGDARYPARFDVYLSSDIDFLDVHIYFRNSNNNTLLSSFTDDMRYMNRYSDEVEEYLTKKCLFMGEFGASRNWAANWDEPNNNGMPSGHDVYTETVRLAREAGIHGFAVWTLESHLQTTWWNLLSPDGTLNTLKDMIVEMHDDDEVTGITAENVSGYVGDAITVTVKGTQDGDAVYFRVGENGTWSTQIPVFDEAGTYTVHYRVVRAYVGDYDGSVTVTVQSKTTQPVDPDNPDNPDKPDPVKPNRGCKSQVGTVSTVAALLLFAAVSVLAVSKKKKNNA